MRLTASTSSLLLVLGAGSIQPAFCPGSVHTLQAVCLVTEGLKLFQISENSLSLAGNSQVSPVHAGKPSGSMCVERGSIGKVLSGTPFNTCLVPHARAATLLWRIVPTEKVLKAYRVPLRQTRNCSEGTSIAVDKWGDGERTPF